MADARLDVNDTMLPVEKGQFAQDLEVPSLARVLFDYIPHYA